MIIWSVSKYQKISQRILRLHYGLYHPVLRIRIKLMRSRIRILLFTLMRIRILPFTRMRILPFILSGSGSYHSLLPRFRPSNAPMGLCDYSTEIFVLQYVSCVSIQGITKRRRLSWLTNSALVYEPKCGVVCRVSANEYSCAQLLHMEPK